MVTAVDLSSTVKNAELDRILDETRKRLLPGVIPKSLHEPYPRSPRIKTPEFSAEEWLPWSNERMLIKELNFGETSSFSDTNASWWTGSQKETTCSETFVPPISPGATLVIAGETESIDRLNHFGGQPISRARPVYSPRQTIATPEPPQNASTSTVMSLSIENLSLHDESQGFPVDLSKARISNMVNSAVAEPEIISTEEKANERSSVRNVGEAYHDNYETIQEEEEEEEEEGYEPELLQSAREVKPFDFTHLKKSAYEDAGFPEARAVQLSLLEKELRELAEFPFEHEVNCNYDELVKQEEAVAEAEIYQSRHRDDDDNMQTIMEISDDISTDLSTASQDSPATANKQHRRIPTEDLILPVTSTIRMQISICCDTKHFVDGHAITEEVPVFEDYKVAMDVMQQWIYEYFSSLGWESDMNEMKIRQMVVSWASDENRTDKKPAADRLDESNCQEIFAMVQQKKGVHVLCLHVPCECARIVRGVSKDNYDLPHQLNL